MRLVTTEKLHVGKWGTFVTTPEVSTGKSKVHLEVTIDNDFDTAREFTLVTSILDANNKEVANKISLEKIGAKTFETKVHNLEVLKPQLWNTENPYLYLSLIHI